MSLPDIPLRENADKLMQKIIPKIQSRLAEIDEIPLAVLLWGPGIHSQSPLGQVRLRLRKILREQGHAAAFSEELCDPNSPYSVRSQQLAQAQEFHVIISMPCTPGSIAEIHDFVADRRVNKKIIVFINNEHVAGYSPQSLEVLSSIISCQIEYYPNETDLSIIEDVTLREVRKIREMNYIIGGRY